MRAFHSDTSLPMGAALRRTLFYLIQFSWALPQNLLGLLLFVFLLLIDRFVRQNAFSPRARSLFHGAVVTRWRLSGSMSMGIFLFCDSPDNIPLLVHEWGHTLQSAVLGPVYLPVIGLPSLVWANLPCLRRFRRQTHCAYTSFYPERWASRWGEKGLHLPALR